MKFKTWHNKDEVLVLRTCKPDMTSPSTCANGFKWPKRGRVEAPDWDPIPKCGHGLHGLLWGEGFCGAMYTEPDAVWLVVATKGPVVDLVQKCKFPEGRVVHCGDKQSATQFLYRHAPHKVIFGLTLTVGDCSSLIAGYSSTLTAGDDSTLIASSYSNLAAGDDSNLTAGYYSTLTAGYGSTLTSGECSNLTAGNCSTLTAGFHSTLTAGRHSTLNAGAGSTLTAGEGSYLIAEFFGGREYKKVMVQVGEDGIKPDTPYKVNGEGQFVEVLPSN